MSAAHSGPPAGSRPARAATDPLREAMRAFPYGLYAVGVAASGRASAFTANWVTQVSSDPPLVAVAVEADAPSLESARAAGVFSITLYASGQRREAALLARLSRRTPEKLQDVAHRLDESGLPIIEGGVAWLICRLERVTEVGDHVLLIGRVERGGPAGSADTEPLTIRAAGFRYG